ncbi:hypothetical protein CPB83DRAFT_861627 [Crepidotus variabilis]|uniref:DUF2470 domain-containing protein n=1 Tax=Crepidotus variabilis TaxID=179855 RepID=A0A9P6E7Z0_9AGAR|nr:hypothetical protein CPB83DRAFT_861627 [Crepidotus variabilis]
MGDSVAEKAGFLKMYMSNHPDTLVAYAKWFGKVKETIKTAEMTAIDSKSMTLTCQLQSGQTKVAVVPIEPPLRGYEDVKPRLLEMKAHAQEGLGMIKAPKISTFTLPRQAVLSTASVWIISYCYLMSGSTLPFAGPANWVTSSEIGRLFIALSFWAAQTAHILESLYTLSLCRRHSTGFFLGAKYVFATIIAGFPIWVDLRKKIQQARIDSVMKIQ